MARSAGLLGAAAVTEAILTSLIALGSTLGLEVVAAGVEARNIAALLADQPRAAGNIRDVVWACTSR